MISNLILRSADLSLTMSIPGCQFLERILIIIVVTTYLDWVQPLKNPSYLLTEYISNVIYRRVRRRNTAKNPDRYKFVQEHLNI